MNLSQIIEALTLQDRPLYRSRYEGGHNYSESPLGASVCDDRAQEEKAIKGMMAAYFLNVRSCCRRHAVCASLR